MLIFHPDISPFPKPALKKRGPTAPSSPKDSILGVQSHQGHGGCHPGLIWVLAAGGNTKCVPPSLLRPPFPAAPTLHRHVGLRGGQRAPVTCWLSPGSHPSLCAAEPPPPARLAPLPQATRPLGPTVAWREL